MAESFFKAFLRFVDAEAGAGSDEDEQPPQPAHGAGALAQLMSGSASQSSSKGKSGLTSEVRLFGDLVAEMHEALAEGRLRDCCAILGDLHDVLAATPPTSEGPGAEGAVSSAGKSSRSGGASVSSSTPSACPHCKRTVASVALHLRTCPVATAARSSAASSSTSDLTALVPGGLTPSSSTSSLSSAAASPPVDPRREIVDALAARLQAAILSSMGDSNGGSSGSVASVSASPVDVDALAPLWVDALGVPGLGGSATSSDNTITAAFSRAVGATFRRKSAEVLGRLQSVRGVLAAAETAAVAAASAAAAAAGAIGPEGVSSSLPHAFLRRHRVAGALTSRRLGAEGQVAGGSHAPTGSSSNGTGGGSSGGGAASGRGAAQPFASPAAAVAAPRAARAALFSAVNTGGPGAADADGASSHGSGAASSSGHPHMEALAAIITQGTALMERTMSFQVPHAARRAVSSVIHEACSAAALSILTALAQDIMLPTVGVVAQSALDHADALAALPVPFPGPPEEDPWDDILDIFIPVASSSGSGSGAGAGSGRGLPAPSTTTSVPSAGGHEVLTISMEAVLHVLDETADQLSFACQLLERYSRAYAVTQALGAGGAGSAATAAAAAAAAAGAAVADKSASSDALLVRVQELQASYVLIERGYLVTGVGHAIAACGGGWSPVAVHSDPAVRIYAWCDNAFFLLGKALARSAATGSDIAAAATTNYVASCLQDAVGAALRSCVTRCGWHRRHPEAIAAAQARAAAAAAVAAKSAKAAQQASGAKPGADPKGGGGFAAALLAALDAETDTRGGGSSSGGDRTGVYTAARTPMSDDDEDDSDEEGGAGSRSEGQDASRGKGGADGSGGPHTGSATGAANNNTSASAALTRPALSLDALWALNSVATTGDFAAALTARAVDEMAAVFPVAVPEPSPEAKANGVGGEGGAPSNLSSPSSSSVITIRPDPEKLRATHPYLHGPLLQLADAATEASAMLSRAVSAACTASCARGMSRLSSALGRITYALSPAEHDAVQANDPLLSLVRGQVIRKAGLTATTGALLRSVADALVLAVASKVASAVEERWLGAPLSARLGQLPPGGAASQGPGSATTDSTGAGGPSGPATAAVLPPPPPFLAVSDLGALLTAAQVRELGEAFGELTSTGSVRAAFARLHQIATVLSIESLSELYTLAFPAPALSSKEVLALLGTRAADLRLPLTALTSLTWANIDVTDRSDKA